jgi:hypothetical protein
LAGLRSGTKPTAIEKKKIDRIEEYLSPEQGPIKKECYFKA